LEDVVAFLQPVDSTWNCGADQKLQDETFRQAVGQIKAQRRKLAGLSA